MLTALTVRVHGQVLPIPLDHPLLRDGWWEPEWHGPSLLRRWTDGDARLVLPPGVTGPFLLELKIGGRLDYPLSAQLVEMLPQDNEPALSVSHRTASSG